jgi:putative transcriptional regulator
MKKYKSKALCAIHESAVAKFEIGAISKERMREFDEMAFVQEAKPAAPVPHTVTQKPSGTAGRSGAPVYARGK